MLWVSADSTDIDNVAWPVPSSVPEPIVVIPSLKVTFPVGVPPELVTVAVSVTGWEKTDGLRLDAVLVVVSEIHVFSIGLPRNIIPSPSIVPGLQNWPRLSRTQLNR